MEKVSRGFKDFKSIVFHLNVHTPVFKQIARKMPDVKVLFYMCMKQVKIGKVGTNIRFFEVISRHIEITTQTHEQKDLFLLNLKPYTSRKSTKRNNFLRGTLLLEDDSAVL